MRLTVLHIVDRRVWGTGTGSVVGKISFWRECDKRRVQSISSHEQEIPAAVCVHISELNRRTNKQQGKRKFPNDRKGEDGLS